MVSARCCSLSVIVIASLTTKSCSLLLLGPGPAGVAAAGAAGTAGMAAAGVAIPTAATAAALAVSGGGSALAPITSPPMRQNMYFDTMFGLELMMGIQVAGYMASTLRTLSFITVGADAGANASAVTWDCWKPMLHDTSTAPSRGRLLTDLLNDPVIDDFRIESHVVFVRNRWNESWRIDPVTLPWGQVAAHASQMESTDDATSVNRSDAVVMA
eukprot:TRINITY_DN1644_c0_g1_i1.p1 TRINITY_DN1644_c0_g1~~TRINITY_DN1644_c0_g1_i1.p1  ORF type:complete len:214 (+),score=20.31 TRINITY_DN1644_c0_g1_i1:38-679(+)